MWCKRLDTVVFRDQKAIDYFTDEVILVKINAEVDTALARGLHVSGYPTAVLIDTTGDEIDRVIGFYETAEYLQILQDYKNGIGTLDDLLNRAKTESDNRELAFDIGDKYKYRGGNDLAVEWFDKVVSKENPLDSLSGLSRLAIANLYYRAKEYEKSLESYDQIKVDFSGLAPEEEASIWGGIVYEKKGDTAQAISRFEEFIKQFPQSEDVEYAQEQIDELKGTGKKEE